MGRGGTINTMVLAGLTGTFFRPLAIAVIGAVCISILFSLVATPTLYSILIKTRGSRSGSTGL